MNSMIAKKYFLELSLKAKALKIMEKRKYSLIQELEKDLVLAEKILDTITMKHSAPVEKLLKVDSRIKGMRKETLEIKEKMIFYS